MNFDAGLGVAGSHLHGRRGGDVKEQASHLLNVVRLFAVLLNQLVHLLVITVQGGVFEQCRQVE